MCGLKEEDQGECSQTIHNLQNYQEQLFLQYHQQMQQHHHQQQSSDILVKFHQSYHGLSPQFTISTRRTSRQTTQFVTMTHFLSLHQYRPHTGGYSIEELPPFSLLMMVPQMIILGSYLTLLDPWLNLVQLLSGCKLS